jgi:hypothetical protein
MIANSTKCWTCQTPLVPSQVHKIYMPSPFRHADLSLINENIKKILENNEEIIKRIKALEEERKPDKGNVILILDD